MFSNLISAGLNTTTVSRSLRIEEELAEELVAASTNSSLISIYLYTSFQIQNSDIDCLFAIGDPRLYRVFAEIFCTPSLTCSLPLQVRHRCRDFAYAGLLISTCFVTKSVGTYVCRFLIKGLFKFAICQYTNTKTRKLIRKLIHEIKKKEKYKTYTYINTL